LAIATERVKKIRKAAGVAAFNGWTAGIFAALSAPFALFSMTGFLVTVGLAVIAYDELHGRKRLLQFDPAAATQLGWNQVALLTMIVVYCLWMMFTGLTGAGPFAAEAAADPEIASALSSLGDFDELYKVLVVAIYGTVIVLSAIFQGLNALYYFTRRKHVEAYVQETPEWVLNVQRMTTPG
jgi:ABC-type enterobactin transport system permease subunit